jgi:AsmA protein
LKILRIVGATLIALVALIVVAVAVIAFTFDPNAYRGHVAEWVEARTGREFRIDEDLQLSYFPWLAVETGGVVLGNAPGFGDDPFLSADRLEIRVKLMPLLRRQLEVGTVILEGMTLNLAVTADGDNNWADLLSRAEDDAAEAVDVLADDATFRIENLDVEGFRVRGGRLTWRENTTQTRYLLTNLNVESGPIAIGAPIALQLSFEAEDLASEHSVRLSGRGTAEIINANAVGASDVQLDFVFADQVHPSRAEGRLTLATFTRHDDGSLQLGGTTLTGQARAVTDAAVDLDVAVRFSSAALGADGESISVQDLNTDIAGIRAAWQLEVQGPISAPDVRGRVTVSESPLASVFNLMDTPLPTGTSAASLGNFTTSADFDYQHTAQRLALDDLVLTALGAQMRGNLRIDEFSRVRGSVQLPEFTPGEALLAMISPHLPDGMNADAFRSVALAASLDVDTASGRTSLRDLRASLLGASLEGELDVAPSGAGQVIRGRITTSPIPPENLAAAFGNWLPEGLEPGELGMTTLDTRFVFDTAADTATFDPLRLQAFGLNGSGTINGRALSRDAVWTGNAEVQAFSPRDLLNRFALLSPETSDPTVLTRASARAGFEVTSDRGRFNNIELNLDDSRITGTLTVDGFDNPAYLFALAIDQVNADRYLPPRADEVEEGEMTAGDLELEVEAIRTLRLSGSLEVGSLALANMQFQQVATRLDVGNGRAQLSDARARLYGGEFNGSFGVDLTGTLPAMTLSGRASGLAMRPIITALTGDANLSGTGGFELDLAGSGAKISDNVQTARGRLSFSLSDGAIEGFNLGRGLCVAYNVLQRAPAPPSNLPRETRFEVIQGSAEVRDGVAHMPDLLGRASFLDVNGSGRLVLTEQYLDYQLQARMTGPLGISNCETMDALIGESIPLRLRGPVTDPEIAPDYSAIIERLLRREAERRITDRLQDLIRSR